MASNDQIAYLLKRAIPDALDPVVRRAVGATIPRLGDANRYRITYTGAFSSRVAADLLAFGRNQRLDGALILIDDDFLRAIYYGGGAVVGADSNVLFERLGRILLREDLVDETTAALLVRQEEAGGVAAAAASLPAETARFALERRTWEIAAALFLIHHGHFLVVEGAPAIAEANRLELNPLDLALEGLRRYDEWRNGTTGAPVRARREPTTRPPTAPSKDDAVEEFLRRLRAEV